MSLSIQRKGDLLSVELGVSATGVVTSEVEAKELADISENRMLQLRRPERLRGGREDGGKAMKALDLIRESGLPPELHAIVEGAFEDAWFQLKTQLGRDICPEHARIRLASIILLLTRIIKDDPERLKIAALRAFNMRHE